MFGISNPSLKLEAEWSFPHKEVLVCILTVGGASLCFIEHRVLVVVCWCQKSITSCWTSGCYNFLRAYRHTALQTCNKMHNTSGTTFPGFFMCVNKKIKIKQPRITLQTNKKQKSLNIIHKQNYGTQHF